MHVMGLHKQQHVCNSIPEYSNALSAGCQTVLPKCRAALKHLVLMLLRDDPDEQQCNNFALKSMRGCVSSIRPPYPLASAAPSATRARSKAGLRGTDGDRAPSTLQLLP